MSIEMLLQELKLKLQTIEHGLVYHRAGTLSYIHDAYDLIEMCMENIERNKKKKKIKY